ncbi:MAG TPA: hypothetical protein VIG08_17945 [Gemmatimonadales bacterium]|jgi:hypothetical protein
MGPFDAVGLAIVCVALFKIVQAISHAFTARRPVQAVSDPELLAEVDALRTRLAEVEERLDFAERLLARVDAGDQLPGRVER